MPQGGEFAPSGYDAPKFELRKGDTKTPTEAIDFLLTGKKQLLYGNDARDDSPYDPSKTTRFETGLTSTPITLPVDGKFVRLEGCGSSFETKKIVAADAPPMPLQSTPAYSHWTKQFEMSDKGKKYYGWQTPADERARYLKRTEGEPDPKARAEAVKDILQSANDLYYKVEAHKQAEALGLPHQGYNETDEEYRERLDGLRADPKSPIGPNGAWNFSGAYFGATPAIEDALDDWQRTGTTQHTWAIKPLMDSGLTMEQAIEHQAEHRTVVKMLSDGPSGYAASTFGGAYTNPNEKNMHGASAVPTVYAEFAAKHPELKPDVERMVAANKEINETSYSDPKRNELRKEIDGISARLGRMAVFASMVEDGRRMAGFLKPSELTQIGRIRDEAKATLSKPKEIWRGMPMPRKLVAEIQKGVAEKGFYDLPASPLWSWTSRQALASTFARHGQGKKDYTDNSEQGVIIKTTATKDNCWMHPDQPTYVNLATKKCASGEKFNSGGCDQKEYIIHNPTGYFRITKDNFTTK